MKAGRGIGKTSALAGWLARATRSHKSHPPGPRALPDLTTASAAAGWRCSASELGCPARPPPAPADVHARPATRVRAPLQVLLLRHRPRPLHPLHATPPRPPRRLRLGCEARGHARPTHGALLPSVPPRPGTAAGASTQPFAPPRLRLRLRLHISLCFCCGSCASPRLPAWSPSPQCGCCAVHCSFGRRPAAPPTPRVPQSGATASSRTTATPASALAPLSRRHTRRPGPTSCPGRIPPTGSGPASDGPCGWRTERRRLPHPSRQCFFACHCSGACPATCSTDVYAVYAPTLRDTPTTATAIAVRRPCSPA